MVEEIREELPKSVSKACRVLGLSRSVLHYKSVKDDSTYVDLLRKHAEDHPREGFWKAYGRIRNQGVIVNHKRLFRIYQQTGMSLRRKCKRRLPNREKQPLVVPETFTQSWSIDFTSDALSNGRKFRSFNVIDDYNREVLYIEVDYSLKSSRVVWVLNHLINRYGKPQNIRMDNGPELIAGLMTHWSAVNDITFQYIQPGKPMQNGYIERFNRTYRENVLDAYIFESLDDVRDITDEFVKDYNHDRPHDSLGGLPPVRYREESGQKLIGGECSGGVAGAERAPNQFPQEREEI